MSLFELFVIAVGLAMDSFAVSICKGLSVKKWEPKHGLLCGLYFGFFQGFMPVIGYFIGSLFLDIIEDYDHWVAFILLAIIGINMIRESREEEVTPNDRFDFRTMSLYGIATSIDALSVGVTFSIFKVNLWLAVALIFIICFILSFLGTIIGFKFSARFHDKAELAGGIILILIGTRILLEHLEIFVF